MKRSLLLSLCCTIAIGFWFIPAPSAQGRRVGINVVLNTPLTSAIVADLSAHGTVLNRYDKLNAVTMRATADQLAAIQGKPYVAAANPDAERQGSPVDPITASDLSDGLNTWNLDSINVTNVGAGRTVAEDGSGVFVAVLDSGLLDSWRQYFPEQRIAVQHAVAFSGGGGEVGQVSTVPNQWEHDQNSHGTHVTSTVLGFSLRGTPINGVAPLATVIPVKVLNQSGSGWSSVVAAGIVYVADLARGPLAGKPVVINMSLGGSRLDAIEKAAIDYAIASGVIVIAAAGNEGDAGMTYPGAYEPVVSVAASGWTGEWTPDSSWWVAKDVADGTVAADFYITDFSGRQKDGQDLDVAAPGSWVVGPYQYQSGTTSYYFLGGTSMASPHVAGIAALMMQKNPALRQGDIESILTRTAIELLPGCRDIVDPNVGPTRICWEADAAGAGLVTADAALAAVGGSGSESTKRRR